MKRQKEILILLALIITVILIIVTSIKLQTWEKEIRMANPEDITISIIIDNRILIINKTSINMSIVVENRANEQLSLGCCWFFSLTNLNNSEVNLSEEKRTLNGGRYTIDALETETIFKAVINTDLLTKNGEYSTDEIIGKYEIQFKFTNDLFAPNEYFEAKM